MIIKQLSWLSILLTLIIFSACSTGDPASSRDDLLPTATIPPTQEPPTATPTALPPATVTPFPTVTVHSDDVNNDDTESPPTETNDSSDQETTVEETSTFTPEPSSDNVTVPGFTQTLFFADFNQGWPSVDEPTAKYRLLNGQYFLPDGAV